MNKTWRLDFQYDPLRWNANRRSGLAPMGSSDPVCDFPHGEKARAILSDLIEQARVSLTNPECLPTLEDTHEATSHELNALSAELKVVDDKIAINCDEIKHLLDRVATLRAENNILRESSRSKRYPVKLRQQRVHHGKPIPPSTMEKRRVNRDSTIFAFTVLFAFLEIDATVPYREARRQLAERFPDKTAAQLLGALNRAQAQLFEGTHSRLKADLANAEFIPVRSHLRYELVPTHGRWKGRQQEAG